jgi:hypothetical protein
MRPRTCDAKKLAHVPIALALVAGSAWAAEPKFDKPSPLQKRQLSYWDQGEPRLFVSGREELGLYVKSQVAAGYGQPYWFNATVEAFGMSTTSFGAGYAGIRGALPFLDLRIGSRYTYSYHRSLLPPKPEYTAEDVANPQGPNATYTTLETELTGFVPAFDGFFFPVITIYRIVDVPQDKFVFDESLRGVADPPWIMGFRLGYVKNFGRDDFIKAGVLNELVVLPGRSGSIYRVGPAAAVRLTDHLEAQGTITFVLASPDSLGLWHGSFGVLGVVYRWATGDPHPEFP